jgi:hypothetical protein
MNEKIVELMEKSELAKESLRARRAQAQTAYNEALAPFERAHHEAERAVKDARASEATEVARNKFGLAVGDVVNVWGNYGSGHNGHFKILNFTSVWGDDAIQLNCIAAKLKKDGTQGARVDNWFQLQLGGEWQKSEEVKCNTQK